MVKSGLVFFSQFKVSGVIFIAHSDGKIKLKKLCSGLIGELHATPGDALKGDDPTSAQNCEIFPFLNNTIVIYLSIHKLQQNAMK